jgi:transposase
MLAPVQEMVRVIQRPRAAATVERGAEADGRGGGICAGRNRCRGGGRADVRPGQIYRWRQELRSVGAGFALVVVTADADCGSGLAARSGEAIEIQLSGVACLRIPPSMPPGLAAAVVQALVRR